MAAPRLSASSSINAETLSLPSSQAFPNMAPSRCGELNLDLPRVRRRAHGSWTLRSDIAGILPKAFSDGHPRYNSPQRKSSVPSRFVLELILRDRRRDEVTQSARSI